MFNDQSNYVYKITLPESTSSDVIEWFEIMEANGKLAGSLIELVYERIKSQKPLEGSIYSFDSQNQNAVSSLKEGPTINQSDFWDSLYDWQGSCSAAFKDEKKEKKVKKKMLYV
ncbi:MAG: hypothetical protein ACOYWZ_12915 [Bacillota bacterium]